MKPATVLERYRAERAAWPIVKWTRYGRWSEDGREVYAASAGVVQHGAWVIYRAQSSRVRVI